LGIPIDEIPEGYDDVYICDIISASVFAPKFGCFLHV